jgi:hypothetical protein
MGSLFEKNIINKIIEYLEEPKTEYIFSSVSKDECNECKIACYHSQDDYLDDFWFFCQNCGYYCDECSEKIRFYKCICDDEYDNGELICMKCINEYPLHLHYIKSHPSTCIVCDVGYGVKCLEEGCDWEYEDKK